MTIVNQQIEHFRQFLISAWPSIDNLMENHDWDDDVYFIEEWLQANWEFLVERELLGSEHFLSTFEGGLDGSRVTYPDAKVDYAIICKPKDGVVLIDDKTDKPIPNYLTLIFQGYMKKVETSYGLYPPFDYASLTALESKSIFYVPVENIDFHLEKIVSS